jgi:hypothetical protein
MVPSTLLQQVTLAYHLNPNFHFHQHRPHNPYPNLVIHFPNPLLKITYHPLLPLHSYPSSVTPLYHRTHPGLWQILPLINQPLILYQTGFKSGILALDFWMDINPLQ